MTEKKVVGKLDMNEVEQHILSILEHVVDTYNLIYQTRGISDELPLRIGHLTNGEFTDIQNRQHIFHAMPKYDVGMLIHILTIYSESNIIGDEDEIAEIEAEIEADKEPQWIPEGIGIDTEVEE